MFRGSDMWQSTDPLGRYINIYVLLLPFFFNVSTDIHFLRIQFFSSWEHRRTVLAILFFPFSYPSLFYYLICVFILILFEFSLSKISNILYY